MCNVEVNNSVLNKGITGDIIIGNGNNVDSKNVTVPNNIYSNDDFDFDKPSELLEKVSIDSKIRQEGKCAAKEKQYANKHDPKSFKKFISDNKIAFTSGTFATVAGGLLLNLINKVLKF